MISGNVIMSDGQCLQNDFKRKLKSNMEVSTLIFIRDYYSVLKMFKTQISEQFAQFVDQKSQEWTTNIFLMSVRRTNQANISCKITLRYALCRVLNLRPKKKKQKIIMYKCNFQGLTPQAQLSFQGTFGV